MRLSQALNMAFKAIFANKMRSVLTMLGIVIGISSVIIMVAVGNGSKQTITESIEGMGTNLLTVSFTGTQSATITSSDIKSLKQTKTILNVAPTLTGTATVKAGDENETASVEGTVPIYATVRDLSVAYGRFITQDDVDNHYQVLDIGSEVIENLYPDLAVSKYSTLVGQYMKVNGSKYQIIGILESKGTSTTGSSDNRVILPLTSAERLLSTTKVKTYYAQAASSDQITAATNALSNLLYEKFSSDTTQYRVLSQSDLISTSTSTTSTMTNMLVAVAAISLVVGGIGIMNIMLVSVIERTREIGIRKAIGAKRRDIMMQFLIEAVMISCLSGLIGVLIGVVTCLIAPHFTGQPMVMSPSVMLLAFLFSVGVGVLFGFYPAAKASKLRPIDALRYE